MLRGPQAPMISRLATRPARRATPLLMLLLMLMLLLTLPSEPVAAQLPQGFLPSPQVTSQPTLQPPPRRNTPAVQQEMIPLAKPKDSGEIVVEEQGAGLISLKVRDASLKQVVAMIAETQRVNILFSAPLDIQVTGSLIRVPWRQALETLLASTGHTWTDDQGILVVTTLAAAETIAPRAGGRRVETFELDFVTAVDVDQAVKGLLSPAGKSWVTQTSITDNRMTREVIAVVDFPGNLQQIADYIGQVDQPPRQVLIKANILQVKLDDDCSSGVNLQQLVNLSGNQVGFSSIGFASGSDTSPLTAPLTGGPATFLQLTGGSLNGLVELLQKTTDAKSLASTELLVVSGQEAHLQSGQRLGYKVTTTSQTNTSESVEFLEVGVVLSVIPQITRDGRVMMRIKPKVSTGDVDDGVPNEDTVEVETDILLHSGQGLVIGGMIQEKDRNVQHKVPWLGDIPYAGALFQKRELLKSRFEIIVTLIPHVMPFQPIEISRNDHRMMRSTQPLLSPPLNRFPRPYEAQLPDTFTNPTPIRRGRLAMPLVQRTTASTPIEATTIEATTIWPGPTVEAPQPPASSRPTDNGPLCYPPTDGQQPTPAPQQASRRFPTHR